MKKSILILLLLISISTFSQDKKMTVLAEDIQIKTAVLAAPEDQREGAMVYGYDDNGEMKVLRKGIQLHNLFSR